MSLADAVVELQELTERLRRECPWDREQTARTIVPHTVEEAYEVADAALADDDAKLLDEIGDLLFQCVFLALTLQESGEWRPRAGSAAGVTAKLIRRHPHIFGAAEAASAGAVRRRWEEIKREDEGREGVFHDVPEGLPALLYARKVQLRARSVGFEYPDLAGALADFDDEVRELRDELPAVDPPTDTEPDRARRRRARRRAVRGGQRRSPAERRSGARAARGSRSGSARGSSWRWSSRRANGKDWTTLPLDEQDAYYDEAKER